MTLESFHYGVKDFHYGVKGFHYGVKSLHYGMKGVHSVTNDELPVFKLAIHAFRTSYIRYQTIKQ